MTTNKFKKNQEFVKKISMNISVQVVRKKIFKRKDFQRTLFKFRILFRKHLITTINLRSEYFLFRTKFYLHQTRKKILLLFQETARFNYLARLKTN